MMGMCLRDAFVMLANGSQGIDRGPVVITLGLAGCWQLADINRSVRQKAIEEG